MISQAGAFGVSVHFSGGKLQAVAGHVWIWANRTSSSAASFAGDTQGA